MAKINPAIKRQALEKLRAGLTLREVSDMFAVSPRTLDRWQHGTTQKKAVPGRQAAVKTESSSPVEPPTQTGTDQTPLDFQDSPEPVEKKTIVEQGMESLRNLLGIKPDSERKSVILPAKLDSKRQAFVDSVTPTVSLAFTLTAAWAWTRIGPEYNRLAPDDKTATRIVEPVVRIYARHASFLTEINPDIADAGASLVALIAYIYSSLSIYQQIKEDIENDRSAEANGYRTYRENAGQSSGSRGSGRQSPFSGPDRGTDTLDDKINGNREGLRGAYSTDKEAAQHAALSRLSELDYQTRARRAGKLR